MDKSELDAAENQRAQLDDNLKTTKEKAITTARFAMNVISSSYEMLKGVLELGGITIDRITNAIVTSSLQVGNMLLNIASAETVTPGMQAAAVITFLQAGFIIGSAIQMQQNSQSNLQQLAGIRNVFGSVNSFIGRLNY